MWLRNAGCSFRFSLFCRSRFRSARNVGHTKAAGLHENLARHLLLVTQTPSTKSGSICSRLRIFESAHQRTEESPIGKNDSSRKTRSLSTQHPISRISASNRQQTVGTIATLMHWSHFRWNELESLTRLQYSHTKQKRFNFGIHYRRDSESQRCLAMWNE